MNETEEIKDAPTVAALIQNLGHEDRDKRMDATVALVEAGEAAVELLIAALQHENIFVRSHAATALGRIGDKRAIEPLNQLLDREDEDSEVGLTATVALGKLGDDETFQFCLSGLQDSDSDERAGSAVALGLIADRRAVEPLIAALKDPVNNVRCFAAAALGDIGDERALPALEEFERKATRLTPDGRKAKDVASKAIELLKHLSDE